MGYKKKSWKEKLEDVKGYPKFLSLESNFPCRRALEKMGAKPGDGVVITPPRDVFELMSVVPEGKVTTTAEISKALARRYDTDYCCTLTAGIHITIAANAAVEIGEDVPYWRTVKNTGELNAKYPGGAEEQKSRLEEEGPR